MSNSITVLVTDLIFSTKIASTARSLGVDVHVVRSVDALNERLSSQPDPHVWIDLAATGTDPIDAIRAAHTAPHQPRILAYVSHVQTDLAEEARQAGADPVLPRSAFSSQLPSLLEAIKVEADTAT